MDPGRVKRPRDEVLDIVKRLRQEFSGDRQRRVLGDWQRDLLSGRAVEVLFILAWGVNGCFSVISRSLERHHCGPGAPRCEPLRARDQGHRPWNQAGLRRRLHRLRRQGPDPGGPALLLQPAGRPASPLGQLGAGRRRRDRRPLGPHGGPDIRQHPHADRPAPPLHVRLGPAGRPVRGVHAEPAGRPVAHGPADLHGLPGHRLKADDQPLRDPQHRARGRACARLRQAHDPAELPVPVSDRGHGAGDRPGQLRLPEAAQRRARPVLQGRLRTPGVDRGPRDVRLDHRLEPGHPPSDRRPARAGQAPSSLQPGSRGDLAHRLQPQFRGPRQRRHDLRNHGWPLGAD